MDPAHSVPVIDCPRRRFGDVVADPHDAAWHHVTPVELRENVHGGNPTQGTQVRCAWDDAEFRALFTCVDEYVWATQTERDGPLWEEEVVEIFVDPIGDGQCYFEFEVNPLNAVLDIIFRKNPSGWKKDFAWECDGFRSAIQRTNEGWNAELAIPFSALGADLAKVGSEWRVNFCRIDRPLDVPRELSAWSPTMMATFHDVRKFGRVKFVD